MQRLLGGQSRAPYEIRDSQELILQEKACAMRIYSASIVSLLREPWEKVQPGQVLILTLPQSLMNLIMDCLKEQPYFKHQLMGVVLSNIRDNFETDSVDIYYEIKKKRHSVLSLIGFEKPTIITQKRSIAHLVNAPKKKQRQTPTFYCQLKKPLN